MGGVKTKANASEGAGTLQALIHKAVSPIPSPADIKNHDVSCSRGTAAA